MENTNQIYRLEITQISIDTLKKFKLSSYTRLIKYRPTLAKSLFNYIKNLEQKPINGYLINCYQKDEKTKNETNVAFVVISKRMFNLLKHHYNVQRR